MPYYLVYHRCPGCERISCLQCIQPDRHLTIRAERADNPPINSINGPADTREELLGIMARVFAFDEWMYVAKEAYTRRQSIVFSADDAKRLALDGLPGSKVIIWEAQRWTLGSISDWMFPVQSEMSHFPQPLPTLVQIWPNYEGFKQHNSFEIQRMNTSQPEADEAIGWPL
jgi:hypothetical protein